LGWTTGIQFAAGSGIHLFASTELVLGTIQPSIQCLPRAITRDKSGRSLTHLMPRSDCFKLLVT